MSVLLLAQRVTLAPVAQRQRTSCMHTAPPCGQPPRAKQAPRTSAFPSRSAAPTRHSLSVMCQRDWQRERGGGARQRPGSGAGKQVFFKLNGMDVTLAEEQLWRLALPLAAALGVAVFVGPLVVSLLLSAVAVGAAFSAGALAFSTLLLPLLVLMGVGGLLSFGLLGALGAALIIPQAIMSAVSMAFVGGGLLLGWGGVNWLLKQAASAGSSGQGSRSGASSDGEEAAVSAADQAAEAERLRAADELRAFDDLLARIERRQQQQRRP